MPKEMTFEELKASYEPLLEAAKRALNSYGSSDSQVAVIKQLEKAIIQAEGK